MANSIAVVSFYHINPASPRLKLTGHPGTERCEETGVGTAEMKDEFQLLGAESPRICFTTLRKCANLRDNFHPVSDHPIRKSAAGSLHYSDLTRRESHETVQTGPWQYCSLRSWCRLPQLKFNPVCSATSLSSFRRTARPTIYSARMPRPHAPTTATAAAIPSQVPTS
jgi:hypothetical protein